MNLPSQTTPPEGLEDVAAAVVDRESETREALASLVEIPSISADGHDPAKVRASARQTADILRRSGLDDVRTLEVDGAHPYVYGAWTEAAGAPTVLLYAHHDVQPVATPDRWQSDPFTPTERDGRLFARGAADDKAGIMVHAAAIRAWLDTRGRLPINVKVIVEGEEEIGSPHLAAFLGDYLELLRADVIVLTDLANWKVGWPALTYALRGLGVVDVTVRTLQQPIHSGMWGGPTPDAFTAMTHLLATLHDEQGRIAVAGFADDVRPLSAEEQRRIAALDPDPDELRTEARLLGGVEWIGDGDVSLLERLWMQPTITPIGIDAPDLRQSSNTLLAEVRVRLSCRFAPGQDPERALRALAHHLEARAPWGVQVTAAVGEHVPAWVTEPGGPAWEAAEEALAAAWGRRPAAIGAGGTIPFAGPFAEAFGGVPCLLTGVEDPATNAHGEDESLHLGDFLRACLGETFLFSEIAARAEALADRG